MQLINPCRNLISLEDLSGHSDLMPYLDTIDTIGILTEKSKSHIDFGCYAYLTRKTIDGLTYVDPSTLDSSRVVLLQNLLDDIANDLRSGQKRIISVWSSDLNNLRPFFTWLDSNAPSSSLSNEHEINLRYAEYTQYLLLLKSQNKDLDDYTSRRQHAARKFFRLASTNPKFSLGRGVPIIARPVGRPVPPPEEEAVTQNLTMAYLLFTQLADFVLDFSPYPLELKLPKEVIKVIPCTTLALINSRLSQRDSMQSPNWRWDYETGTINSAEYIAEKYGYTLSKATSEVGRATKYLKDSNDFPHHHRRLILGSWAQTGFQILMLSATGIDLESLRTLPWSEDIVSVPSERQGFRVYKARAQKSVYFEIQSAFVPMFNKYLKLRSFILNGRKCNLLFFRIQNDIPLKIDDQFLQTYHDRVSHMLDSSLPRIVATEYRKYKANWILDTEGPEVASLVSQNTLRVFNNRYSSPAKSIRQKEFTKLFTYISDLADSVAADIVKTPPGSCIDVQNPMDIGLNIGVEKDCTTFWGCVFCIHYALHADAEDLTKLKSMAYTIETIRVNSLDFTPALAATLERVKFYIKLILEQNSDLIAIECEIDKQLANGSLHPYWQAYIDLWALTGKIK